jgi:O-antigen ligase
MNFISNFKKQKLLNLELVFISLMILSLPSLEAPKNIFLILFVVIATFRQVFSLKTKIWRAWDWIFASIIFSGFLTTIFAGISHGEEWKGFRVLLTFIAVGWLIYRSSYTYKQIGWIFLLAILSTFPPLMLGLSDLFISHSRDSLQLHSVGHVNHSAIYLSIIFGASLGWSISFWSPSSTIKKVFLYIMPICFYISILISQSRAAFGVSTLIALFIFFIMNDRRKTLIAGVSSLLIICLVAAIFNASIFQKQLRYQKSNNVLSGRSEIWNTTLEAARFSPLLGIGIDNRANVTKFDIQQSIENRGQFFDEKEYDFHYKHAHSFYLTQLCERGIIGSLVTLFFIIFWLRELISSRLESIRSKQGSYLWSGSLSAWIATFGIGLVNTTFHHEHGILACLFLGLHLTFLRNKRLKVK